MTVDWSKEAASVPPRCLTTPPLRRSIQDRAETVWTYPSGTMPSCGDRYKTGRRPYGPIQAVRYRLAEIDTRQGRDCVDLSERYDAILRRSIQDRAETV